MAQVTTGEVSFLVASLVTVEIAGIGVLIKMLGNAFLKRLDRMEEKQDTLYAEIPKTYVAKSDYNIMIDRVWARIDGRGKTNE